MSRESYDRIAAVYATDMGQSMAFDDIGYYRDLCHERGGRTLELGCGTGRILLPLLQSGIAISGIDQSPGMLKQLQQDAQALGLQPDVSFGSLTAFSSSPYRTILAPYSVVTYLTNGAELATFFKTVKKALSANGLLVVDTFIPRPVQSFSDFRQDYRRPHAGGTLQREKRITLLGECNRIERRYTVLDAMGIELDSWTTLDEIRPWTEAELIQAASTNGFSVAAAHGNFSANRSASDQFVTLHFAPA